MKHYIFNGEFCPDNLDKIDNLIDFVNNYSGYIVFGLNSGGGELTFALFLLDMLNMHAERIHLKGLSYIDSAAFTLWLGFKGKKSVYPGTSATAHMSARVSTLRENGRLDRQSEIFVEDCSAIREIHTRITIPVLTLEQRVLWHDGRDIYIPHKQLVEIAETHNKLINMP